jgi:hypothetical protein
MVYDIFEAGAAGAPYVKYKREAFLRPGEVPVAFSLALFAKDQDLISDLAALTESRMDQAEASPPPSGGSRGRRNGDRDISEVAEFFAYAAGTPAGISAHLTPHFLGPDLARPPSPRARTSPSTTNRVESSRSGRRGTGEILGIDVFLGFGVVPLIFAAQAPAVHKDLAVAASALGHQTPVEGRCSRRSQVAINAWPSAARCNRNPACG